MLTNDPILALTTMPHNKTLYFKLKSNIIWTKEKIEAKQPLFFTPSSSAPYSIYVSHFSCLKLLCLNCIKTHTLLRLLLSCHATQSHTLTATHSPLHIFNLFCDLIRFWGRNENAKAVEAVLWFLSKCQQPQNVLTLHYRHTINIPSWRFVIENKKLGRRKE